MLTYIIELQEGGFQPSELEREHLKKMFEEFVRNFNIIQGGRAFEPSALKRRKSKGFFMSFSSFSRRSPGLEGLPCHSGPPVLAPPALSLGFVHRLYPWGRSGFTARRPGGSER